MRRQRVAAVVLAVLVPAAGIGAAVLIGGGGDARPATLPLAGGGGTEAGTAAGAPTSTIAGGITYELGPDVPELGGTARAYRLEPDVEAVARRLAAALDLPADALTGDESGWRLVTDDHELTVSEPLGSWSYYRLDPAAGGADVGCEPGYSCASAGATSGSVPPVTAAPPPAPGEPSTTTTLYEPPERPADLPTEEEAEARALELLGEIGIDVDGAAVTTYDNITAWSVNVDPRVDGLPTFGLTQSVNVGEGGQVLDGYGVAGTLVPGDEYPLIGTPAARQRLEEGGGYAGLATSSGWASSGWASSGSASSGPATTIPPTTIPPDVPVSDAGSATEPAVEPTTTATVCIMIYPPPPGCEGGGEPVVVTLVDAEVGLAFLPSSDGSTAYLVPAYLFTTEDGAAQVVVAIPPEFIGPVPNGSSVVPTPTGLEDDCVQTEQDASGTTLTIRNC